MNFGLNSENDEQLCVVQDGIIVLPCSQLPLKSDTQIAPKL